MKTIGLSFLRSANRTTLWLILTAAVLWGWVLPQIPLAYDLEFATADSLVRLDPAPHPTGVQVLLFKGQDPLTDRILFSRRVEQILAGGARGVILNLPEDFDTPLKPRGRLSFALPRACFTALETDLDCPLRQVVARHHKQLILITRASSGPQPRRVQTYNHFQSLTEDGERYRYSLEEVLAVQGIAVDGDGIVRRLRPSALYTDIYNSGPWVLQPAAVLAAAKWGHVDAPAPLPNLRLAPAGTVAVHAADAHCPTQGSCTGVRDKIVILGPPSLPIPTIFGEMDPLEVQAQMFAAVLHRDFYGQPGPFLTGGIVVVISVLWLLLLQGFVREDRPIPPAWQWLLVGGGGAILWLGVALLGLWATSVLLPTFVVLGALLTTTALDYGQEVYLRARQTLLNQQQELEQLRRAERQAILNQARKLLYRVATDIHDQELQQLKLVMDDLECYVLSPKPQAIDHVLDQLQDIGRGIRDELSNIRTLAEKLEITPQLKQGLHQGIRAQLEEARAKGDLVVRLETDLEPLAEPLDQSQWLDAREDIFRFFREALTNALRHSQPPRGTSTYLKVMLKRNGNGGLLVVENDGAAHVQTFGDRNPGYGTKAMNTISSSLPQGYWKRELLAGGRVKVTLGWDMQSGDEKS
ncbi:sensor histidine kinase [Anthocerotibacter panamensis]|uniref:sensor histidine kinase n=1 Tax=Anthocerotibacter panamensis TaxID=2857077 RepID=UPI001C40589A|nr:CHASE2 domain-containing protein [Anthocerotibacter panamensis]